MCTKSLNPNAKEFKPRTLEATKTQPKLLHPHHIYSDSTTPPQTTVVPFTVVTQPPQPVPYVQYYPICHLVTVSAPQPLLQYHYSHENVFPPVEECFYRPISGGNGKPKFNKLKGHVGKGHKYPCSGFTPPRMMTRVIKSFPVTEMPKKVWRPKARVPVAVQPPGWRTTVMIRHIPNTLRRDFMLNCMDNCSRKYSLEYDFLYLPMDFRSGDNLGYAFVNFTSPAAASTFKAVFDGYKWERLQTDKGPITSKKVCHITWARVQGKDGLLRRFERARFACSNLDFLPVLLDPPRDGSNANPSPPVIIGNLNPTPS